MLCSGVWYDVLFQINVVNKKLQPVSVNITASSESLKDCLKLENGTFRPDLNASLYVQVKGGGVSFLGRVFKNYFYKNTNSYFISGYYLRFF